MAWAALVLPAACGPDPAPPPPQNSQADAIEPGLWTINRSVLSQRVGDAAAEVAMAPTTDIESKCLAGPVSTMIAVQFMTDTTRVECRHDRAELAGGKVEADLACTPPPTHSDNRVTASGDYAPGGFTVTVATRAAGIAPNQTIEQRKLFEGKRTGSC